MKIKGRIVIKTAKAPDLAAGISRSLEPDNLDSINTEYAADQVITVFEAEKIGSLIATVDDYLLNARIAQDMINEINIEKKRND